MTADADRHLLLRLASEAITAYVNRAAVPSDPEALGGRTGAAFVTIHSRGELRGCIGHLGTNDALGRVVPRCAVAACSTDPRFPPIALSELRDLEIEVSLLGPLERIAGPQDVEIGRHGLVVQQGSHRGLLLPQVAIEWKWDAETFLAQTCRKAGLHPDAWKTGAEMWRFEAEVFGDQALHHGGH